jgi:hypothetical protein
MGTAIAGDERDVVVQGVVHWMDGIGPRRKRGGLLQQEKQ